MKNSRKSVQYIIKFLVITGILFLTVFYVYSNESEPGIWITCEAEVILHQMSINEAQVVAKQKARLQAIEQVCGISLQAETLVKNFRQAGDFIHAISYGQVVDEKDIQWTTETHANQDPSRPPFVVLCLSMQAKVIPVNERPDPEFKVFIEANRSSFQSGEEMILKIKSSEDAYITVLNLAANDSVYVLYPNVRSNKSFVKANTNKFIPSRSQRKNGFKYRVFTLSGHHENTEMIKVIATKKNVPFLGSSDKRNMGTPRTAMTKLAQWLSTIPIHQRSEVSLVYTIRDAKLDKKI